MNLIIDGRILKGLSHIHSHDETRFVLCGVRIEVAEHGVTLVATDGRRLATCYIKGLSNEVDSITIPTDWLRFFNVGSRECRLILSWEKATEGNAARPITIRKEKESGRALIIDSVAGNYPAWRQVLPTKPMVPCEWNFNTELLRGFFDCVKAFGRGCGIAVRGYGELEAYAIYPTEKGVSFFGLLMPMRIEVAQGLPEWLTPPQPKEESKAA